MIGYLLAVIVLVAVAAATIAHLFTSLTFPTTP